MRNITIGNHLPIGYVQYINKNFRGQRRNGTQCNLEIRQYPSHYWLGLGIFGQLSATFFGILLCNVINTARCKRDQCTDINVVVAIVVVVLTAKQFSNILAVGYHWKRLFMTGFILAFSRTSSFFQSLLMLLCTLLILCWSFSFNRFHCWASIKITNVRK